MAFIAVLSFAAVIMVLAVPLLVVMQDEALAEIAKEGIKVGPEFIGALCLVLAGVAVLLALAIYFLVLLRRIVLSVGEGYLFVPINADRLARMGWLALAGQIAVIPLGGLVMWIAEIVQDSDKIDLDSSFSIDPSTVLMALILFILARVFPPRRRDARRTGRDGLMPDPATCEGRIVVSLDELLHARRMTLTELAARIDITIANLSILKTGKAKAIRFSTLEAICAALECQPGDLLEYAGAAPPGPEG